MSAFNKLMEEFSAATGVDTVVDGERSCTLEADGILVTLQYLEDADEVVLFAPARPSSRWRPGSWQRWPRLPRTVRMESRKKKGRLTG